MAMKGRKKTKKNLIYILSCFALMLLSKISKKENTKTWSKNGKE